MSSISSLHQYMSFAAETAYLAGRLTLGYFGTGVLPEFKADDSPVTVADRLAEQLIRGRIERAYPDHAIVGEEFGATESGGASAARASHRWFIDPIDGTKSFLRGVPLYGVLLGLEIDDMIAPSLGKRVRLGSSVKFRRWQPSAGGRALGYRPLPVGATPLPDTCSVKLPVYGPV